MTKFTALSAGSWLLSARHARFSEFLNRLPYNNEPGGRATLRSFRGRGRARLRALPRGRALRRGRHRAARLSTAGPQLRVDRQARSRDLRLPAAWAVGIRRPFARSGSARPQAGLRHAARTGPELLRSVHRLHGPRHGLRRRRRGAGDGQYDWRLAGTNVWKVERMLLDYPHRSIVTSDARAESAARAVSPVPREVRLAQTRAVSAARPVDVAPCGVQSKSKSRVGLVTGS